MIPRLGGRRVPVPAAVVPAALGALACTVYGVLFVWTTLHGEMAITVWGEWLMNICYVPMVAWGPLPAVVTVAHRLNADPERMGRVFAVLGDRGLEPGEARRRVGRLALDSVDPEAEAALIAGRADLIGADAWPERRLLITAVDATTGEPVVWDRDSGVPLVPAVAASSAFPGAAPPVAIDGRRYMDGALRAGPNADLAAGARTLVVVDPSAHLFAREPLDRQPAAVAADTVVTISPDAASVRALGSDMGDLAAWEPAYQAGLRQAGEIDAELRSAWRTAVDTD